jgi:hypothetical protein
MAAGATGREKDIYTQDYRPLFFFEFILKKNQNQKKTKITIRKISESQKTKTKNQETIF